MNKCKLIASLLLLPVWAEAQEVGGYGFLELPVSAHAMALGGPVVSVVDPEAALAEHNSALLCPEMSRQWTVSYMNWLSDIHLAHASYTGRFLDEGAWQSGVRYVNYGTFDGYDEWGSATGTFGAKDIAFHASVGYPLSERWRIGGALRAIYSKYESESAFAMGADIALNYYNEVAGRSISFALTNLGGQLRTLGDRRMSLPNQLSAGITKEVEHLPFAFTLTGIDLLRWEHTKFIEHLILSAEWLASDNFFLAAGYSYRRQHAFDSGGGFLRGVSFGGGFNLAQWHIACSYARYNASEGSLLLELGYRMP